ncbi:HD domain-containing protein [Bifidobacterium aquikefiricola]|uniref:HDIG domain-containing protein n=1 Tax=Bifidobacterium aquikefiricola TaxID=3059038 RepID=A0AB39U6B2_9BIFI
MTRELPNQQAIDELHHRYAPSQAAYQVVHTHCHIVSDITFELARKSPSLWKNDDFDLDLALVGAWLHDIGTYQVFMHDGSDGQPLAFDRDRYILHGILGYRLLLQEGWGEEIAQFARNHTGVGLYRQDVIDEGLPLLPADYVPRTDEQELVMYADKFNSKSVPPSFIAESKQNKRAAKFGDANYERWRKLVAKYGLPDISQLAERYRQPIRY